MLEGKAGDREGLDFITVIIIAIFFFAKTREVTACLDVNGNEPVEMKKVEDERERGETWSDGLSWWQRMEFRAREQVR